MPTGVQTQPVVDTLIGLVLSGKFVVLMISVLSQPKAQVLRAKAYMVVGRVAITDQGVHPSFSKEPSMVRAEISINSQL